MRSVGVGDWDSPESRARADVAARRVFANILLSTGHIRWTVCSQCREVAEI